METPAQVIGTNVKAVREDRGMTGEEFGKRIGEIFGKPWPRQTVYMMEKGKRALTAEDVIAIAMVLDVPIANLFIPSEDVDQVEVGEISFPREQLLIQGREGSEHLYEIAHHTQALRRSMRDISKAMGAQQIVIGNIDRALRGMPPAERPEAPSMETPDGELVIRGAFYDSAVRDYELAQRWYEPDGTVLPDGTFDPSQLGVGERK